MVEGVSGGTIYHPIPFQQKLFAQRPSKNSAAAGQGRNEHWIVATNPPKRVSAIAPPPERSLRVQDLSREATPTRRTQPKPHFPPACPQTNPSHSLSAKALCPNAPEKWCSSGTGPERALDRSNKSPKARQRNSPISRAIPASAGPVPRTHPHEPHIAKDPLSTNLSRGATPKTHHRVETSQARAGLFDWAISPQCA